MRTRPAPMSLHALVIGLSALLLPSCSVSRPATVAPLEARSAHVDATPESPELQPSDLDFVIRRESRAQGYALVIDAGFTADASGRTELDLPSSWGGQKDLWKDLSGLSAASPGASIEPGPTPDHPTLVSPPGARVSVRYEFPEQPEMPTFDHARSYRPLVQKDWFHFIGYGLFVTPHRDADLRQSIHLAWRGFPKEEHLANSFGTDQLDQHFEETSQNLRHSVYVGGDFRITRTLVRGKPIDLAMRGTWKFTDREFADLVSGIVDTERAFFADDDFDRFLVTLIPTGGECCSYGGTGLTDSFATFVATNLPIDKRMKHLLAHELFHTWNGRRIKRQDPEELVYWFSEGFTDYYAGVMLLRAGLTTFPEYVEAYNQVVRSYSLSPARNARNQVELDSFWTDTAVERLPYERGNLLAHEWNARIHDAGHDASIDDVMRDLFHDALANGAVVSASEVDRLATRYLDKGIAADVARYVDDGETIPVSAKALGPCVKVVDTTIGRFDLGFDEEKTDAAHHVVGVVKGSAAEKAGLRDGMTLRHSRYSSDATKPAVLTVLDHEKERTITYLPQGPKQHVPQYRLDEAAFARDPARCIAPLVGSDASHAASTPESRPSMASGPVSH